MKDKWGRREEIALRLKSRDDDISESELVQMSSKSFVMCRDTQWTEELMIGLNQVCGLD